MFCAKRSMRRSLNGFLNKKGRTWQASGRFKLENSLDQVDSAFWVVLAAAVLKQVDKRARTRTRTRLGLEGAVGHGNRSGNDQCIRVHQTRVWRCNAGGIEVGLRRQWWQWCRFQRLPRPTTHSIQWLGEIHRWPEESLPDSFLPTIGVSLRIWWLFPQQVQ